MLPVFWHGPLVWVSRPDNISIPFSDPTHEQEESGCWREKILCTYAELDKEAHELYNIEV